MRESNVIIVGSGIAALQLAVQLPRHLNVIVITKSRMKESNSSLAQGGIAAAIGSKDNPCFHYADTLEAGRNINNKMTVRHVTSKAPKIIQELTEFRCRFDRENNNKIQLGKEGAHSHSRIIHGGGDQTGAAIIECLVKRMGPNIHVLEEECVYELLINREGRCFGVNTFGKNSELHTFVAPHVVLATGGCGQLYRFTSNSRLATGEGIALAYWAGAKIKDMEFIQFHPTLLFNEGQAHGLISEAVRGEGARLVDEGGKYLMDGIHPLRDLAPRHIVAQAIYHKLHEGKSIYLDVRPVSNFEKRFPAVSELCRKNQLYERIPVAPGCHFLMGGIETDLEGKTSIAGLYAIGEAACTGLHGANRLASNSLLEALVFGKRLAQYIGNQKTVIKFNTSQAPKVKTAWEISSLSLPKIKDIQFQMMQNVGIVRTGASLRQQLEWIDSFELKKWVNIDFANLTEKQWQIISMLQVCYLITRGALDRTESRGGHYRSDFPLESEKWLDKRITHLRIERRKSYEQSKA
ncbi:L-aspartate oxidase [Halobacillus sp. A5]|uniref:L-aspartate oxidase n=1 Tax=Halobacillus sp. A5 TaxID=2880263 RepID=UPI0020A6C584|nr:L-aspartate oxidase [Halobacillus sp. A5]MCP3027982.1 L-aspartate oxidase [Halobacillus sp. A5]